MSVREDREKSSCSSRGLGLAAAAIGVGVGAALYYYFNRAENHPDREGSSQNWQSNKNFRERTNSLEECSVCFEIVLKDQDAMTLPCTHCFHTKCILPWLQERQTCPNCRQAV